MHGAEEQSRENSSAADTIIPSSISMIGFVVVKAAANHTGLPFLGKHVHSVSDMRLNSANLHFNSLSLSVVVRILLHVSKILR